MSSSTASASNTSTNPVEQTQLSPNSSISNVKPAVAGLNRNFSTGAKLDRTQSLRTAVRPLGPFNGPRESRTTDVSFTFFFVGV